MLPLFEIASYLNKQLQLLLLQHSTVIDYPPHRSGQMDVVIYLLTEAQCDPMVGNDGWLEFPSHCLLVRSLAVRKH